MRLEIKQDLRLSQQLILVPQLQLSLKLLQMPTLELEEYLKSELEVNPALEELSYEKNRLGKTDGVTAAPPDEAYEPEQPERAGNGKATDAEDQYLESIIKDSDIRIPNLASPVEMPSQESYLVRAGNLADHLSWQLGLQKVEPEVLAAAGVIIGNLNDNGYLEDPLEALAGQNGIDVKRLEEALAVVQKLDPSGVGARDMKECLLIQAAQLGLRDSFVPRVIREGLEYVAKNDPKGLSKALSLSPREASQAIRVIKGLNPKPGRTFSAEEPNYVTPDVAIRKVGNDYEVLLNNDSLPNVVINPVYRQMAQRRDLGEKERAFIRERVRSALWLIKSIDQRQKTIYKVAKALVKFQRDFLDHGISFLKPLTLKEVAREVGVHESTVSRVTSNKTADTPHGILRMKRFFSTGMVTRQGTNIATEAIKHDFHVLIENENKRKPLSDMEIAKHLRSKGINISRRTVAKYREQAGIPPAYMRRQR
ncbi:MAG: RNA polymerase factor sigma-54 [Nitrospirae bacterium]|nr:RNA polymerase factor sigma-54 [Nitrospirota bacterium]